MVSPYFFLKKLTTFFSHRLWKVMTFLAVVSLTLPSYHVVYQVFFLNLATKKLTLFGCHPLDGITRGGPPLPPPSDAAMVTWEQMTLQ